MSHFFNFLANYYKVITNRKQGGYKQKERRVKRTFLLKLFNFQ